MARMLFDLKWHLRAENTIVDIWETAVDKYSKKVFLEFVKENNAEQSYYNTVDFTYQYCDQEANKLAHYLKSKGIKKGATEDQYLHVYFGFIFI
jgi:acyl-CoA synthetase (AMP-forming)/AMP-acid ligase II